VIDEPRTLEQVLARMDAAWEQFRALAVRFPPERMDEHIGGWTRKQMLAHVGGWHDSAADRLLAFAATGERQTIDEDDEVINARIARAAAGRTAGEVLHAVETSFRRLRRQVEMLNDEQLMAHDSWPMKLIVGVTHEHYEEHRPDLEIGADLSSARD